MTQSTARRPRWKSKQCVFCHRWGSVQYRGDQRRAVTLELVVDPAHDHHPERRFYCCADSEACSRRSDAAYRREQDRRWIREDRARGDAEYQAALEALEQEAAGGE